MIKFGTGGWRAIIGKEFTYDNIRILCQAAAQDMINKGYESTGIVIGYDRRFLSETSAKWAAEVFAGNGIKVHFIDKIAPTPLIMFAVKRLNTKYGLAVTASHNPADYNGIKVFTEGGRDASEVITKGFEQLALKVDMGNIKSINFDSGIDKGLISIIYPFNEYIDNILNMIDVEAIRNRRLRILLDPMFGVSKTSLQTILLTARCDVEVINDRHDTLFGGRLPSPSEDTLTRLRSMVVEGGFDLGIGTDGDADRLGVIDDKGNFIHPNQIMVLLYYYMLEYKGMKGGVVRNLATTHQLDRIADFYGEKCYEVPVGFKHISSKMEETDSLIGGESSGGLTIRGHIKGKDGIFAASILVELLSKTGKKISEFLEEINERFGSYFMIEKNYHFDDETKKALFKLLYDEKGVPEFSYEVNHISYFDGVKVYFKNGGWIIARFSGTEPLLRIYSEMGSSEAAEIVCCEFKDFLGL